MNAMIVHPLSENITDCSLCSGLVRTRTKIVNNRGLFEKKILIIGEAPGKEEDEFGIPFIGICGKLLTDAFATVNINLQRDCLLTNIVKCRPKNNNAKEIKQEYKHNCSKYLISLIVTLNPKIIVCLGNTPTKYLLGTKEGISKVRGRLIDFSIDFIEDKKIFTAIATYHPSALIREAGLGEYNKAFLQDLLIIKKTIDSTIHY